MRGKGLYMRPWGSQARQENAQVQRDSSEAAWSKGKVIAVAFGLAVEWGLAFAFAKRFADVFANANADLDAYAAESVNELRRRVQTLEADHGREWSVIDDRYRPGSTIPDHTRLFD